MPDAPLRRTALHDVHVDLGARFTAFGGWEMPVRYGSIIDEHHAVRRAAGIFDLSHMGELRVSGAEAASALASALVSDPGALRIGRAQYSMICAADGGIIDDLIVYRLADDGFLVVPNASNRVAVAAALDERFGGRDATLSDDTLGTSLLAIQGPRAASILGPLTDLDLAGMRSYTAAPGTVAAIPALVARTGYTGEDGFELFVDREDGPALWGALLTAGGEHGLVACGLGARDTLRLEAGMPLYGNELSLDTSPFEAGLGWVVKLDRDDDFVGRAALEEQADATPAKRLVGLAVQGRGIARHGYQIARPGADSASGVVTSGSQSPTLGRAIAMAYVRPADAAPGTMLEVSVRDNAVPVEVVPLPFYRRGDPTTIQGGN